MSLFKAKKSTDTIIQMEGTECGAVCLGIILSYYGKYVPIEELRILCSVSRDGVNALNVAEAAKHYGLTAEGYSCEVDEIDETILPAMIHWKFEHFIILESINEKDVRINDPATGPRTITHQDFDESFTGVVVTFEPGPDFVRSGSPPKLLTMIWDQIKHAKMPWLFTLATGVCLLIPTITLPAFSQVFIDQILINKFYSWKGPLILGMLLAVVISTFLTYLQLSVLNRLNISLSVRSASVSLWHMLRLPLSFYQQRNPGEIANRINFTNSISDTLTGTLATTVISLMLIVVYGIVMLYYDVFITLVAFAFTIANFLIMRWVYLSRLNAYACYQVDYGKSTAFTLNGLDSIETLKATGSEQNYFARWAGYYTKVLNSLQIIGEKDIFLTVFARLFELLTTATLLGVGGWRIITGQLTIGMFVALQILMRNFMTPVSKFLNLSQTIQLLKVEMDRLNDITNYPIDPSIQKEEEMEEESKTPILAKLEGYIAFENISFSYSPMGEKVLKNLFFELTPGKTIGLVGPTGGGKSTTSMLIAGLFQPTEGRILFDGKSREEIPRRVLTSSLAIIEQTPFLFAGTLRDNLTLYDNTVSQQDLLDATNDSCLHDLIISRKGSYDMFIEQNGQNLSAGERQRIEIARGLIKKPSIIILDEATAPLDTDVESAIIRNIRRRGCSLLIVAHRLSTIHNCDEIIVLHHGEIQGVGTHRELMEAGGLYKELIESEYVP